ncbi:MAG: chemotaxis protein CheC [Planctomycetota bacterium]
MSFSTDMLAELGIVASRGAEHASSALSTFIGRSVHVDVGTVNMVAIEQVPERLGAGEVLTVALVTRVAGEITGNAALLFQRPEALQLVRWLGSPATDVPAAGFGELERSMLEETANITISSFMNSITAHLAKRCVPNAPMYLMDLAGAILSVVVMESAAVADTALLFSTRFLCDADQMQALFVFLPSPEALQALREGLEDG